MNVDSRRWERVDLELKKAAMGVPLESTMADRSVDTALLGQQPFCFVAP